MKPRFCKRGLALLLVMWALFVMNFAIIGLLSLLTINIGGASGMERVALASSFAFAGVTLGRNDDFPVTGEPEKQTFPNDGQLEVYAVSENGRLNVNRLLESGDRETLRALFRLWGLSDVEADTVLDCLFDYVEPGGDRRLNGAKAPQYRAAGRPAPPGRLFRSIDEMTAVLHFDLVTERKPAWRDDLTIYGDGTLDLRSASPEVIRAFCRVGDSSARAIRRGAEHLNDMEGVRMALGLTSKEFEPLRGRLSLGGKVRRIHSTGISAQAKRTIEAIYQIGNTSSVILEWREW
ncbi:MAG TPA: hypothetical protein VNQ90_09430 [Chthoniobacteraceae bacterium]|nr:hypothetical protein [Chthoniobacteraceae bacterium]